MKTVLYILAQSKALPPAFRLHIEEGFVPLVPWSAESDKEKSHLNAVECVQGWGLAAVQSFFQSLIAAIYNKG